MKPIIFGLFGAGGMGREVMPYVTRSVSRILGASIDDIDAYFVETWVPKQPTVNGYPLISMEDFLHLDGNRYFNVAIGSGRVREAIANQVGSSAEALTIWADQVIFFDENNIGAGALFCPNTVVTSNVTIGRFFQANYFSHIAHDCIIGDYVTFAPGVRCNGRVHIGDHAYIGTNAILREGVSGKPLRIGAGAVVGMGAVVTKDIPDGVVVVGNPATELLR